MRPKTRQVTMDNQKHHMKPGVLEVIACNDPNRERMIKGIEREDAVTLELNHCMVFLDPQECMQTVLCLINAGKRQWGDEFVQSVTRWLEKL